MSAFPPSWHPSAGPVWKHGQLPPRKALGSQVPPSKDGGDSSPAHPGELKERRATISAFSQNTRFPKGKGRFCWPSSKRSFRLMLNYQAVGHQGDTRLRKAFKLAWDGGNKFSEEIGAGCFFYAAGTRVTQFPLNSLGQTVQQNMLSPCDLISSRADS